MLDVIREMSENLAEMGFALAGKALSGVFAMVRDVALKVEEHTGIPVPFAHSGMPVVVETEESVPSWQTESAKSHVSETSQGTGAQGAGTQSAGESDSRATKDDDEVAASAAGMASTVEGAGGADRAAPGKSTAKKSAAKRTGAKKTAARKTGAKSGQKKSSRRKSATGAAKGKKKSPGKNSQVLRLLDILARDSQAWMSAVELSAATADQGSRILPGNVRKAIRLRAEGLIESRTRPGSKRGATEYRITEKGLAYLEEHK